MHLRAQKWSLAWEECTICEDYPTGIPSDTQLTQSRGLS